MKTLPNKLSALVRIALADMRLALQKGYTIDMTYWVQNKEYGLDTSNDPISPQNCLVCMAGSVMVGTLQIPAVGGGMDVEDVPFENNQKALHALNNFRQGEYLWALEYNLGVNLTSEQLGLVLDLEEEFPLCVWGDELMTSVIERERFFIVAETVAKKLESVGL